MKNLTKEQAKAVIENYCYTTPCNDAVDRLMKLDLKKFPIFPRSVSERRNDEIHLVDNLYISIYELDPILYPEHI